MPLLEFQGHALETLLFSTEIRQPPEAALLPVFLLLALAYQWLRSKAGVRYLTGLSLAVALLLTLTGDHLVPGSQQVECADLENQSSPG